MHSTLAGAILAGLSEISGTVNPPGAMAGSSGISGSVNPPGSNAPIIEDRLQDQRAASSSAGVGTSDQVFESKFLPQAESHDSDVSELESKDEEERDSTSHSDSGFLHPQVPKAGGSRDEDASTSNVDHQAEDKYQKEWIYGKDNYSISGSDRPDTPFQSCVTGTQSELEAERIQAETDSGALPDTSERHHPSRSPSTASFKTAADDNPLRSDQNCESCENAFNVAEIWFCGACPAFYCNKCWSEQFMHNTTKRNDRKWEGTTDTLHEKMNFQDARLFQNLFPHSPTEDELERLHEIDSRAKWFGIYHDKSEHSDAGTLSPPTPGESDRSHRAEQCITVLRATSRLHDIMTSTYSNNSGQGVIDHQLEDCFLKYPSIVSFVGETGAGKSALIKGLIELHVNDDDSHKGPHVFGTRPPAEAPVVSGIQQGQGQDLPTSSDVHLYVDPLTIRTSKPILFADCEGLRGGNRKPMAEKIRKKMAAKSPNRNGELYNGNGQGGIWQNNKAEDGKFIPVPMQDREITWCTDEVKQTRQYAVSTMYPRLLYNFSDAIVFVMRNSKVIESVIEILLEWAEAALEFSSNQTLLPYAVIIIIGANKNSDSDYWDPVTRTKDVMESLSELKMNQHPNFTRLMERWHERAPDKNIKTVEQLVKAYYRGLTIIAIPEKQRPKLLVEQLRRVRSEIVSICNQSLAIKDKARLLLPYQRLGPIFNAAFDHFALNGNDEAFDFMKAALRELEQASRDDLSSGFLQLLIALKDDTLVLQSAVGKLNHRNTRVQTYTTTTSNGSEVDLIRDASEMIASSILLDCVRRWNIAPAEIMFKKHYLSRVLLAWHEFQRHHYPCEFRKDGKRCVNVRMAHKKGHQSADGKIIGTGAFQSQPFSPGIMEVACCFICSALQAYFVHMNSEIHRLELMDSTLPGGHFDQERLQTESLTIAGNIRRKVFDGIGLTGSSNDLGPRLSSLKGNQFCFCCMLERGIYPLRCGHAICDLCLTSAAFGSKELKPDYFTLKECPLCSKETTEKCATCLGKAEPAAQADQQQAGESTISCKQCSAPEFYVFPEDASARILALDGGGVRGIVSLHVLQNLELEIGFGIPVQEFFDVIVGTSCGGIIALGLGVGQWTVDQCIMEFKEVCDKSFADRFGAKTPGIAGIIKAANNFTKFGTEGIEEVLRKKLGMSPLFGHQTCNRVRWSKPSAEQCDVECRAAVAVTTVALSGEAYVLGNYNRKENYYPRINVEANYKSQPSLAENWNHDYEKLMATFSLPSTSSYKFLRPTSVTQDQEVKIWEAARATSAAPTFFKSYTHHHTKLSLQDGALLYNNPVEVAISEWCHLVPRSNRTVPDILFSIGTGKAPSTASREKSGKGKMGRILNGIGININQYLKIVSNFIETALDSDRIWENFLSRQAWDDRHSARYKRINLKLKKRSAIDDISAIKDLKASAKIELRQSNNKVAIKEIANRLIATSFYFQLDRLEYPDGLSPHDSESDLEINMNATYTARGWIRTRMRTGDSLTLEMIQRLQTFFKDCELLIVTGDEPSKDVYSERRTGSSPSTGFTNRIALTEADIVRLFGFEGSDHGPGEDSETLGARTPGTLPPRDFQIPVEFSINISQPLTTISLWSPSRGDLGPISSFPKNLAKYITTATCKAATGIASRNHPSNSRILEMPSTNMRRLPTGSLMRDYWQSKNGKDATGNWELPEWISTNQELYNDSRDVRPETELDRIGPPGRMELESWEALQLQLATLRRKAWDTELGAIKARYRQQEGA